MGADGLRLRAKQAAISIKSYWQRLLHEGPSFQQWMRTIGELEAADEDARREFQLQALREIARHAYANVPFWYRRFRDSGFDPERITDTIGLTRLPVLTKREVRDNLADMVSRRHLRVLLSRGVTSGTAGTPRRLLFKFKV